jgi:hypothetical protein
MVPPKQLNLLHCQTPRLPTIGCRNFVTLSARKKRQLRVDAVAAALGLKIFVYGYEKHLWLLMKRLKRRFFVIILWRNGVHTPSQSN